MLISSPNYEANKESTRYFFIQTFTNISHVPEGFVNRSLGTAVVHEGMIKVVIYNTVNANGCVVTKFCMCRCLVICVT
jgi:hypothetical protein